MRRLLSIVGARPQFVKAAELHRALAGRCSHDLAHTGQHYDPGMSKVFFEELGIPAPLINLGVGSGPPGAQVARMIEGLERLMISHAPDAVILYGDTNTTLAGAIAASKLGLPIAHVEAGLRSHRKGMPEELNRVVCDHCSTWLLCPTEAARRNLLREGFPGNATGTPSTDHPHVNVVGDLMLDSAMRAAKEAEHRSLVLSTENLLPGEYAVATVHRGYNTDEPQRLIRIMEALEGVAKDLDFPMILPMHPRTRNRLAESGWRSGASPMLRIRDPLGYLDMIQLERNARLILTDSGGVQKEAFFFRKPCVVLREETEWTELVQHGQARLAGAEPERIRIAVQDFMTAGLPPAPDLYGDGHAAEAISRILLA